MKKHTIVIVALCLCLMLMLTACSATAEDRINQLQSATNATTITSEITVTDGGVQVYSRQKVATINGEEATVQVTVTELGDNFEMTTDTNDYDSTKRVETALPVNLTAQNVQLTVLTENGAEFLVLQQNAAEAIKANGFDVAGDVTVKCTYSGKTLTNISFEYVTDGQLSVSVSYAFGYEGGNND